VCILEAQMGVVWVMISRFAKKMPDRVKGYVRENWGAPFIGGFILLLLVAAVFLSVGLVALVGEVAVVAYYALVVGVVLQSACYLKYDKRDGEKNYEAN
jgi:hypothetical protein